MMEKNDNYLQTTFIAESPLEQGFENYLREAHGLGPEESNSVDRPEDTPATETDRVIDLAKRVLLAGGNRTGFTHHTQVSMSLKKCDSDDIDERVARSFVPSELRLGNFRGDKDEQLAKAKTILAWAETKIDDDVLRDIEGEQVDRVTNRWDTAAEATKRAQAIREFQENLPATFNGWEQFEAAHGDVETAYSGLVNDTPVIVAIYEGEEGNSMVREWLREHWDETGGDPHNTQTNRHPALLAVGHEPYEILYSHLQMFNAEAPTTADSFKQSRPA